jgi:hypothetical protein
VGLSQKRCSKCSKLAEKLREIEELLSSGRYDRAHELVVEIVDELEGGVRPDRILETFTETVF